MKVAKLRTQTRRDDVKSTSLGIALYGTDNDYPEKVMDIFAASPTGKGCLNTFVKFLFGGGFADLTLANKVINRKGQKGNHLLRKVSEDYGQFSGFSLHVNYNALFEITEIQHIPFEHCRIGVDNNGMATGQIHVHPNWNNRNTLYKFKKDEVKVYPVFNPNPNVILAQANGNIETYTGQVYYFSNEGELVYPLCAFDPTVTDMATEESISTVLHRNARYNFLPAGMIVKKKTTATTNENNREGDNYEDSELASEINDWQGDEKAAKMILVETEFDEDTPTFVPFTIQNFDRMFDSTSKYVQDNIGRMFMQPPILRGVDVGAGFGADLMKNAYDFYNSIVEGDRKTVEENLMQVLQHLPESYSSYTILPLEYLKQATNEELGS